MHPPAGRHHDCLWDISERYLGDPLRYKEIFAMNHDRLQPDGRTITDADLIRPGWILRLPADATGPGLRTVDPVGPKIAIPEQGSPGSGASQSVQRASDASVASVVHAPSTVGSGAVAPGGGIHSDDLARYALGGGLLAAGLLTMLGRRRGPFGAGGDSDVERRMRLAAHTGTASFLDAALRGLAQSRAEAGLALPETYIAFLRPDELVLHFSPAPEGPVPAPWVAAADGRSWTVRAQDVGAAPAGVLAPYPALVNVGEVHGHEVLVDLEAAPGVVSVGGDVAVARDVVMSVAVELATNLWSDGVDVTLVGFGDDLSDIAPGRIRRVDTVSEAVARIENDAPRTDALLRSMGINSVLQGRASRTSLRPHVMVLSGPPSPAEAQRILAAEGAGRSTLGVLCVGDTPSARWRFTASTKGALDLGVLGVDVTAHRLSSSDCAGVLSLLRDADRERETQSREIAGLTPLAAVHALAMPVQGRSSGDDDNRPTPGGIAISPTLTERALLDPMSVAAVEVQLLGPVQATAPGHLDEHRRPLLTEIVIAAALHPQGLHDAVLRAAVWPRGVGDDVVDAAIGDAQAWLGETAAGVPRLRREDDGLWVLADDVRCDWHVMRSVAAGPEGSQEAARIEQVLGLVRGVAFSDGPDGRYQWLAFHAAARDSRLVGTALARRLAAISAGQNDRARAERALRSGLRLVPAAQVLWRDLLRLTDPDGTRLVVEDMWVALEAGPGASPARRLALEPETDALVQQLMPGHRRTTA